MIAHESLYDTIHSSVQPLWISVADAALLLKVKPITVIRRIEKGTLPSRTSADMPFTYDGRPNYEVRLDSFPQRLQYQYLFTHLPEQDICSVDLVSPRSSLGTVWLDEFLDISSLIRDATSIRREHHHTGHTTDELRKLASRHGISLATLSQDKQRVKAVLFCQHTIIRTVQCTEPEFPLSSMRKTD